MQRKIKFRGMDLHGDWHYGLYCHIQFGVSIGHYISNNRGHPKAYLIRPETLGQYIGFIDCAHQEIYEGDYIKFDTTSIGGTSGIAEIAWENDLSLTPCPGWGLWHIKGGGYSPAGFELCGCKVVGNIFENKREDYAND